MQNEVSNIEFLLAEWDSEFLVPDSVKSSYSESTKMIISNSKYTTPLLPNTHPDFTASLEPRIRQLVISIINRFGCVTVSSCGGHHSDNKIICGQHLDILPRDSNELSRIWKNLIFASDQIDNLEHAKLQIKQNTIKSDNSDHILISIEIVPLGRTWDLFQEDANRLQQMLIERLKPCKNLNNSY